MITTLHQHEPQWSIRQLCQAAQVSRSWYLARSSTTARAEGDTALRAAIEQIVLDFPGYGYRRVTKQLQRDGWTVNHKHVLRVMRQESLLCRLKRSFVVTTDATHAHRVWPNLLRGLEITRPDQAWVADLTYIRLPTTFCYLACVLDAYSRKVVGWQLGRTPETTLPLGALEQALVERHPPPGLIHHSDRGVQYASAAYIDRLQQAGMQISMSAVGNPYDNAKAESFFKTLKREEVYLQEYRTFAEAEANLSRFIEEVYNTKRLHSRLGYRSPSEFETEFAATLAAATGL